MHLWKINELGATKERKETPYPPRFEPPTISVAFLHANQQANISLSNHHTCIITWCTLSSVSTNSFLCSLHCPSSSPSSSLGVSHPASHGILLFTFVSCYLLLNCIILSIHTCISRFNVPRTIIIKITAWGQGDGSHPAGKFGLLPQGGGGCWWLRQPPKP